MTTLPYVYWSHHLTEVGIAWRNVDYQGMQVVRGLKQEPFNGYLGVKVGGVNRQYNKDNIEEFVALLLPAIGQKLRDDIQRPISIVPVPNSGMAVGVDGKFRCVELAELIAKGYGEGATVCPAIRWDKPREKAHKTKDYRHPDLYEPHMRLTEAPTAPVVLFDDVLTTGSQMIAAARMLTKAGYPPQRAIVVAKATKAQHDDHFLNRREGVLELSDDPFNLDEF